MIATVLAALLTTASMQTVIDDTRVRGFFTDVLQRGARWHDSGESAAFLVADTRGDVQCLAWPATNEYLRQSFRGDVPRRTIAIIHTHPDNAPRPSKGDIEQALGLHLPLYVLTRTKITAVDPRTGSEIAVVREKAWSNDLIPQKCEDQWLAR